jgi:RHS repeat-associated protein
VAPEGTTLYIGAHFQVFVPTEAPPPDPPPTPPPGLTPRVYLPLVMGGCGYLIGGRVVPPVKYYLFNGRRVAVRQGCSGAVTWFYHDHLGSTVASSAGESTRYWPYGGTRTGAVGTAYRYTGQELDSASGLYYYVARWYDGALGRFLQPDALVQSQGKAPELSLALAVSYSTPAMVTRWNDYQRNLGDPRAPVSPPSAPLDPQFLNRYTYARGNPLAYVDDSGHVAWWVVGGVVGAVVGFGAYALTHRDNFDWGQAALWTGGGALAGVTLGAGAQWVAGALATKTAATAGTAAAVGTAGATATGASSGQGLHLFSQAWKYGIDAYTRLAPRIAGTGLEVHHIIEKRFVSSLNLDARWIPSVALTSQEHQVFTNLWRAAIPYGTKSVTVQQVWEAAQWVYMRHPELLDAVFKTLFHQ